MNTVTISLERFKELESFETAVKERRCIWVYNTYSYSDRYYIADDIPELILQENERLANALDICRGELKEIKSKRKWWQIWK